MKMLTKFAFAASALALAPLAPATAQSVAYTDVQQVIGMSQAARTADQQMRVTYKATYEQIETRSRVLQAELNAMIVKFQADQKANANNPSLPTQAKAIQEKQRAAQEELSKLSDPIERVNAYVLEQIDGKLDAAVTAAMGKKKVALLIQKGAVIKNTPGTDLTPDILTELNALVPSVSITPPANWQPGQQQRGAAPAAAPAAPAQQPQGR
ncbi:MAG: OmpH family outer membrane protein [Chakrabartia sp.]